MTPDWKALTPHRPVEPGAYEYEPSPFGVGDAISQWIKAGGSTVLVGGPAGVGKSTELACAAEQLQEGRVSCLLQIDRWENMRRLTADQLLHRIAGKLVHLAIVHLGLPVSADLRAMLWQVGVLPDKVAAQVSPFSYSGTASDMLRLAVNEVARLSRQGRIALLLDGLEKVPEGSAALDLFDALGRLPEYVDLVCVVPWHAAFGPQAETLIRSGEKFLAVRAPVVDGPAGAPGRRFLAGVVARRLGLPLDVVLTPTSAHDAEDGLRAFPGMVDIAAGLSGGLPRMFLQLLADAGTYARIRRDAAWPNLEDLVDAQADQTDSLRRILLPGDKALLRAANGTDGIELDLGARVRLLAHGLLLEREEVGGVVLRVHPLAESLLGNGGPLA